MKKSAQYMILLACGFLVLIFFAPLWHIKLNAPQYPGGLDMYIWINKITGSDEFTLQNINILNHYVGMKPIHPGSFRELQIMPYVVLFFVVTGILTAIVNRKKLLMAWLALVILGGTIGLTDFYLWQQAFGNQLDPNAPIKIEGMTYSPPFLGNKTLLNIQASSYPSWGGAFFGLALALATGALFKAGKENSHKNRYATAIAVAAGTLVFLTACEPKPQVITYGFDSCTHCKMTIVDKSHGSELVTAKGKAYKFDAIECMAKYLTDSPEEYAFQLVSDFSLPGKFIDARQAVYLQTEALPSPMGMNLSAFAKKSDAESFRQKYGGKIMDWEETKLLQITHLTNEIAP